MQNRFFWNLIGWKSGKTTYVPLSDRMEGRGYGLKEGQTGFCQKRYGQTYEQQRHLNEWSISELEADSIQTSLKQLFTIQQ